MGPKVKVNGELCATALGLLRFLLVKSFSGPVLFYDDHCPLCHRSVRLLLWADRKARLKFAALDSEWGSGLHLSSGLDSVILLLNGVSYTHSTAVGLALKELGGLWAFLGSAVLIWPVWIRDGIYKWIARMRPRSKECILIPEDYRGRFLD